MTEEPSPIFDQLSGQSFTPDPPPTETIEQHPIKRPGEPMRYRRDVPAGDYVAVASEIDHVRAHLSSIADVDDDPHTRSNDVHVAVYSHIDGDSSLVSIIGTLDAEPQAPYLRSDFDPYTDDQWEFTRYSEEGRE
jgi:hypothetical protein